MAPSVSKLLADLMAETEVVESLLEPLSVLHYQRGLPQERLAELMTQAAAAVLGVDAPSTHGADGATASVTRLSSGASQRVRTDR